LVQRRGGDVLIGAGTVTNADQAESCLRAGAQFLVSPGFAVSVLSVARANAKLAIPGALTPTELMNAQDHGARLIKIFPCGNVGGAKYLKSLKAPFPHSSLIPTGGVNAANAAEFIAAGAFALGVGADLVDATALRDGNLEKISSAARELVTAVSTARASLRSKKAS
jgi:2-dehydro-3-deoxyphosphogluconate aldolase / (4S)-4-hydroxy-2-oxoglutarate aldolase